MQGTLRAHYLNEEDEPAYMVRVALAAVSNETQLITLCSQADHTAQIPGETSPDALALKLLEVHFHFSRVAELGRILLQPSHPSIDKSVAGQDMLACFSFRDEENLLQKLEMLRSQAVGSTAAAFEWEVVSGARV